MKMNLKLGVPTEALLKHPTACFNLSRAMTRVGDALAFGEFYIKETKTKFLLPRELEHVSASIHTSANAAKLLATLIGDGDLKKEIGAYASGADRLNSKIREGLKSTQKALKKTTPKAQIDTSKMMEVDQVKKGAERLRKKLATIENSVEDLCKVTPMAGSPVADHSLRGSQPRRAGMAGGPPRKRPIYPRYFVASMGRSRR